jgi:hypothetical protein
MCQPIIALMPPHHTYIESHLGGGAIMQRKPPARHSIGIDRDGRALERFACNYPVEKILGCPTSSWPRTSSPTGSWSTSTRRT